MNLSKEDLDKFKRYQYESFLDRYLKMNKVSILTSSVRGAPEQLKEDMRKLAIDQIGEELDMETLLRLKDICEYMVLQKSNRRHASDKEPNRFIFDKFSRYEEQLKQIDLLLLGE